MTVTPQNNGNTPRDEGGDQTNTQNFDPMKSNIWETKPQTTPQQSEPTSQTHVQANGTEQFNNYIQSLKFGDGFKLDSDAIQKMFSTGDITGMQAAMNSFGQNVARQVLLDVSRMIDRSMTTMREEAKTQANNTYETNSTRSMLQTEIPLAANPSFAPVIEGVYAQFLKNAGDKQKALELTKVYVKTLRDQPGNMLGLDDSEPPRGGPGYSRGSSPMRGNDQALDWLAFGRGQ